MYGFTLSSPLTFVVESIHMGPLDEFLRNANESVSTVCLIDAAYSLARALHYLVCWSAILDSNAQLTPTEFIRFV